MAPGKALGSDRGAYSRPGARAGGRALPTISHLAFSAPLNGFGQRTLDP
jgi:hypothetical protein